MTEIQLALQKLSNAAARLREGADQASNALDNDGVIQRFEFTFELLWKTLKIFLEEQGIEAKTPKECLKTAFRLQWITDEAVFLTMLQDRNLTSHIYDESEARDILERIRSQHLPIIENTVRSLHHRANPSELPPAN